MNKPVFIAIILPAAGIAFGQNLHKESLVGVHLTAMTLNSVVM